MKLLTNLIFEPKGKHDPADAYNIKDTVMSADGSRVYFALQDVPAGISLDNEDYWKLQIDLFSSKSAMDQALASFGNYAKSIGTRVKGETAKASGNPVSFLPDAGSLLQPVTVLELQQQGSSDPYPAGGGRNLLPTAVSTQVVNGVTFTVNSDGSITANGTASQTIVFYTATDISIAAGSYILNGCPSGGGGETYSIRLYAADGSILDDSGAGYEFTTGAQNMNAAIVIRAGVTVSNLAFKLMLRLASNPDATYAPYSNIRPISGYDVLELTRHGKNLFSGWAVRGETINAETGAFDSVNSNGARTGLIMVKPSTEYCFSGLASGLSNFIAFYDADKNFLGRTFRDTGATKVFTTDADCRYIAFTQYVHPATPGVIGDLTDTVQLEEGGAATAYTAPADIYTVHIGQTVYGGKLDWTTGKLVAEWAMLTLNGTENITSNPGDKNQADRFVIAGLPKVVNGVGYADRYKLQSWATADNVFYPYNTQVYVRHNGLEGADVYKAYLAAQYAVGTPVQIVYKLATPIEIQLTPATILALEDGGMNTIYGDGNIEVEYVKSLNTSIQERIDTVIASFTDPFEASGEIVQCEPISDYPFDSVVTEFSPKQAGSGDPCPAGGGKNMWNNVATALGPHGNTRTETGFKFVRGTGSGASYVYYRHPVHAGETVTFSAKFDNYIMQMFIYETGVYGTQLAFSNNGKITYTANADYPNATFAITIGSAQGDCTVSDIQIEFGTEVTAYQPYENIRPISDWDAVELTRCGKNLVRHNTNFATFAPTLIRKGEDYHVFASSETGDGTYNIRHLYADGSKGGDANILLPGKVSRRFTLTAPKDIVGITFYDVDASSIRGGVKTMVWRGDVDAHYEPYQGKLHTVQIGETVYGGKFDWLTGKLIAEYGFYALTGEGSAKLTSTSVYNAKCFMTDIIPGAKGNSDLLSGAKSSHFVEEIWNNIVRLDSPFGKFGINTSNKIGIGYDGTIDEANAWLAAQNAAGTPVQIAYKLANPVTIQLDPTEIIVLPGVNTLYGDGSTTVTGRQSKTNALEARLAALEAVITNA